MNPKTRKDIDYMERKVERALSSVGANVADAYELNEQIDNLRQKAEQKLEKAQEELSNLYMELDDEKPEPQAP